MVASRISPEDNLLRYAERYPLFPAVAGFIGGIVLSSGLLKFLPYRLCNNNLLVFSLTLLVMAIFLYLLLQLGLVRRMRSVLVFVFVVGVLCGLLRFLSYKARAANHIKNILDRVPIRSIYRGRIPSVIAGEVVSFPECINYIGEDGSYKSYTRFILKIRSLRVLGYSGKAEGYIYVYLRGTEGDIKQHQFIKMFCYLEPILEDTVLSSNLFFENQNIYFSAYTFLDDIEIVYRSFWEGLSSYARGLLLPADVIDLDSGLVSSVVAARRFRLDYEINLAFIKSGAAHFLAISGFHLGIVGFFAWFLSRALGFSYRLSAVFVIVVVVLYAFAVGPRPALIRAAIMTVIICLGIILDEQVKVFNSLLLAALLILIINPSQLFSVGFQLSFLTLLGIVAFTGPIYRWLFGSEGLFGYGDNLEMEPETALSAILAFVKRGIKKLFSLSLAANLTSVPLVMMHFGVLPLFAPLSSIVLFIPISAVVIFGLAYVILYHILFPLSWVFGYLATFASHISILVVNTLASFPFSAVDVRRPTWPLIVAFYTVIFHRFIFGRFNRRFLYAGLISVLLVYVLGWQLASSRLRASSWLLLQRSAGGLFAIMPSRAGLLLIDAGCRGYSVGVLELIRFSSTNSGLRPRYLIITRLSPSTIWWIGRLYKEGIRPLVLIPFSYKDRVEDKIQEYNLQGYDIRYVYYSPEKPLSYFLGNEGDLQIECIWQDNLRQTEEEILSLAVCRKVVSRGSLEKRPSGVAFLFSGPHRSHYCRLYDYSNSEDSKEGKNSSDEDSYKGEDSGGCNNYDGISEDVVNRLGSLPFRFGVVVIPSSSAEGYLEGASISKLRFDKAIITFNIESPSYYKIGLPAKKVIYLNGWQQRYFTYLEE